MAAPSIESRRRRRAFIMSTASNAILAIHGVLVEGWEALDGLSPDEVGGFEELLQLRFVVIDLAPSSDWDGLGAIAQIRSRHMLNVPIFCFGGDKERRDEARRCGADRCFDLPDLLEALPEFCRQFGW
jgi:hypothetical protein